MLNKYPSKIFVHLKNTLTDEIHFSEESNYRNYITFYDNCLILLEKTFINLKNPWSASYYRTESIDALEDYCGELITDSIDTLVFEKGNLHYTFKVTGKGGNQNEL